MNSVPKRFMCTWLLVDWDIKPQLKMHLFACLKLNISDALVVYLNQRTNYPHPNQINLPELKDITTITLITFFTNQILIFMHLSSFLSDIIFRRLPIPKIAAKTSRLPSNLIPLLSYRSTTPEKGLKNDWNSMILYHITFYQHMLWVLVGIASMRQFQQVSSTYACMEKNGK